ncbi:MAG: DUF4260 domain-containing protein [Chitinophagaceae bacterium]|nr:DUF4260 domain-containing protein [Chitinophagaceae bacterium]
MKYILRIEEAAMFALCLFGLYLLEAQWWWYLLLIIGPDISMIVYTAGNVAGAAAYNFFHHKAVAVVIFILGMHLEYHLLVLTGIVMFGHSSMDRMFGYGLKFDRGFKYTHLGIIGKKQRT